MPSLRDLPVALRATWDDWLRISWSDLQFGQARPALLVFVVMLALAVFVLLVRGFGRRAGRAEIVLPAVLPVVHRSSLTFTRHLPLLLFVIGLPLFAVALADPRTGFKREEVSYPGRRIAMLVDASTSMVMEFESCEEGPAPGRCGVFTALAAAERFIERRIDGPYRDLVALVLFGNYAYVVTPFTNDYDNIRLSVRLIGDPKEWGRFPDWGTTILEGVDQATHLFKTFDFTSASGNLMIIFTDGRDSQLATRRDEIERILGDARNWKIPVHMVRTAYNFREGQIVQDRTWKSTVERTGGRFYAAYDDESIERAIREIDALSPGRIETREYSVQRPRYNGYTLVAVVCWLSASVLSLGFGVFRTFP